MSRTGPPILTLLIALLGVATPAVAHRLDEYLQATIVSVEPGDVRLRMNLTPGVAVAERVLARIDRDHDGAISADEATAYAETVKRDLILKLDGRGVELKVAASDFPEPADLRGGWGVIRIECSAAGVSLPAGPHRLTLENWHMPLASAYLFNAAQPHSGLVRVTRQDRDDTQRVGEIEFTVDNPPRRVGPVALSGLCVALTFVAFAGARRARKRVPDPPPGG